MVSNTLLGLMSAIKSGSGKQPLNSILGGGDDPRDPKKKKVFTSQQEIDLANAEARRIAKSGSHGNWSNVRVADKIGDPIPRYVDSVTGKDSTPMSSKPKKFTVPNGIKLSDIKSEGGIYWYDDPQTGDIVEIDGSVLNLPRFRTDKKQAEKDLLARSITGIGEGLSSILGGKK